MTPTLTVKTTERVVNVLKDLPYGTKQKVLNRVLEDLADSVERNAERVIRLSESGASAVTILSEPMTIPLRQG